MGHPGCGQEYGTLGLAIFHLALQPGAFRLDWTSGDEGVNVPGGGKEEGEEEGEGEEDGEGLGAVLVAAASPGWLWFPSNSPQGSLLPRGLLRCWCGRGLPPTCPAWGSLTGGTPRERGTLSPGSYRASIV